MRIVQQPQRLGLQAMNDVLLALQERMMMQIAVDGAMLLQRQAEWFLVNSAAPCHEDSCTPEHTTCRLSWSTRVNFWELLRLYIYWIFCLKTDPSVAWFGVYESILLYLISKCEHVIDRNRVTWCSLNLAIFLTRQYCLHCKSILPLLWSILPPCPVWFF